MHPSQRVIEAVGVVVWLFVGVASGIAGNLSLPAGCAWGAYGAVFAIILRLRDPGRSRRADALVGVLCVIGPAFVLLSDDPGVSGAVLLITMVTVSWMWPAAVAVAVVVVNTLAVGLAVAVQVPQDGAGAAVLNAVLYLMFHLLVHVMVTTMVRLEETTEQLRTAQDQLVETGRAEERLRIARDLHDTVGHQLTALALHLQAAQHQDDDQVRATVRSTHELATDLLAEVRQTVDDWRAEPTDLAAELAGLQGAPGLVVHVDVDDDLSVSNPRRLEALVRCCQEAVTNAARHSGGRRLWIAVEELDGSVSLTARDDGRGCLDVRPGNGLIGMRERFQELGGEVTWTSSGGGFHVQASMPVAP